jgi:hypothetical protein
MTPSSRDKSTIIITKFKRYFPDPCGLFMIAEKGLSNSLDHDLAFHCALADICPAWNLEAVGVCSMRRDFKSA